MQNLIDEIRDDLNEKMKSSNGMVTEDILRLSELLDVLIVNVQKKMKRNIILN